MNFWTPEQIQEKIPLIDVQGANVFLKYDETSLFLQRIIFWQILGGLYTPSDGHVDPYSLTQAMAAGARMHGAKIFQNAEVTAMTPLEDGRWRLSTPHGDVTAKRVVNASGFHAKEVAAQCGQFLPLVAIHHQVLT